MTNMQLLLKHNPGKQAVLTVSSEALLSQAQKKWCGCVPALLRGFCSALGALVTAGTLLLQPFFGLVLKNRAKAKLGQGCSDLARSCSAPFLHSSCSCWEWKVSSLYLLQLLVLTLTGIWGLEGFFSFVLFLFWFWCGFVF